MSTRQYGPARQLEARTGAQWDTAAFPIRAAYCSAANVGGQVKLGVAAAPSNPAQINMASNPNWDPFDVLVGYLFTTPDLLHLNGTHRLGAIVAGGAGFTLNTPLADPLNVIISGSSGGTGVFINLTKAVFLADVLASVVATSAPIVNPSVSAEGVLNADIGAEFANLTLLDADWMSYYLDTGDPDTSPLLWHRDGRYLVTAADLVSNGGSRIVVAAQNGLPAPIAAGTALHFGNGVNATLSADVGQIARSFTVNPIAGAIPAGYCADALAQVPPGSLQFPLRGVTSSSLVDQIDQGPFKFGQI